MVVKFEPSLMIFFVFLFVGLQLFSVYDPSKDDAEFVEQVHWDSKETEGKNVWSGSDNGSDDKNCNHRIRSGASHRLIFKKPQKHNSHH